MNIGGLALVAIAWPHASHLSPQFDPVALAVQQLAQAGQPPPPGYTFHIAKNNELPSNTLGQTDSDAKTITVDVAKLASELTSSNSTQEFIDLVAAVLVHEYGHTETYGTPSVPPSTGYNTDLCSHQRLYGDAIDRLCELIEQRQAEGGTTEALCKLDREWCNIHNGIWCLSGEPRKFPCDACT